LLQKYDKKDYLFEKENNSYDLIFELSSFFVHLLWTAKRSNII